MEETFIDMPSMHHFARIEPISDQIPDKTMILTCHHRLEKHDQGKQIFEMVKAHLSAWGMTMRQGAIVDATLIAAPSSTFRRAKPDCAGGTRTSRCNTIQRCTRPGRATSGTAA